MITEEISQIVREGTILITVQKVITPWHHFGIVAIENGDFYVYDLHPNNRNSKTGNVKKSLLCDYMRDKRLVGIKHTAASTERIQGVAKLIWNGKYNASELNCQKFIDYVTDEDLRSDLFSYYVGLYGVGIVLATVLVGAAFVGVAKSLKPVK